MLSGKGIRERRQAWMSSEQGKPDTITARASISLRKSSGPHRNSILGFEGWVFTSAHIDHISPFWYFCIWKAECQRWWLWRKEREGGGSAERVRERSSTHWVMHQMPAMAWYGPGQNHDLKILSWFPTWVVGVQALGLSSLLSQAREQEDELGAQQLGIRLAHWQSKSLSPSVAWPSVLK